MSIESHGIDWAPNHTVKDTNKWIDKEFLGNPIERAGYRLETVIRELVQKIQKPKK